MLWLFFGVGGGGEGDGSLSSKDTNISLLSINTDTTVVSVCIAIINWHQTNRLALTYVVLPFVLSPINRIIIIMKCFSHR